ncbi:hypothetical protein MCETE7_00537 [Acidimicrobiia bacterium]
MTRADYSSLSPSDAQVALRSYPRRFAALLGEPETEITESRAQQLGPEGVSALELAVDSIRTWTLLGRALHQIELAESPVLHPAVADPGLRHWDQPIREDISSVNEQIADGANELADAIGSVSSDRWNRTGITAGGGSITAIAIVQEAVQVGAENLRRIERTLAALG